MLDLTLTVTGMTLLCVLAAIAGSALQKRAQRNVVLLSEGCVTTGMAGYFAWLWDRPVLTELFPFSNAIILGNWLPIVGAFFVGVCLSTKHVMKIRRTVLGTSLGVLCFYSLVSPLLGETPVISVGEPTDVILEFQSTPQTCSAACAAGLLRLHGIAATEEELAKLCLTRRGTHWLGVFRGLKIKTAGTEWDVVAEELSPKQLIREHEALGVLALTFAQSADENSVESGFATDVGHTVVSLGVTSWGTLDVFDPSPDYGFETWNDRVVADVDHCIMLRLVSRNGTPSPLHGFDSNRPSTWNKRTVVAVR